MEEMLSKINKEYVRKNIEGIIPFLEQKLLGAEINDELVTIIYRIMDNMDAGQINWLLSEINIK
jgi:hypothetical protein